MTAAVSVDGRWAARRARSRDLQARFPYAAEVLGLYDALLDVQESAFDAARTSPPDPSAAGSYIAATVLPRIIGVTAQAAPERLAEAVSRGLGDGDRERIVAGWLRSDDQTPVDRYLARAAASPVLEALGTAAASVCVGPRGGRHCPACGGLPQLSYTDVPAEALVGSRRLLLCARCCATWAYPRMVCPGCGERDAARLPIYHEEEWLPHVRVEGCESCRHFLIGLDLRRDGRAVPLVDELAAMPLALFAEDQGLTKIAPNLMGL